MNPIRFTDDTRSLHDVGTFVMSDQLYQNAFLSALVNRIGMVIITSKTWDNPWARFKQGTLELGETVEEIFVNICESHSFDPDTAAKEIFKREAPDVRAAFHSMNFQKLYKQTVQEVQLRQAFLAWSNITDLVAKVTVAMYTSMNLDEFLAQKYVVCRELLNGHVYPVKVAALTGANADKADSVRKFREYTNNLTFMKTDFNMADVWASTPIEDQVIIIPNETEAVLGVDVLANAFNISQVDYIGNRVPVDTWSFTAQEEARLAKLFENDKTYKPITEVEKNKLDSIVALKCDAAWMMDFDVYQNMTSVYNTEGLYWNYTLHAWKILSISPFKNVVAFVTKEGKITKVEVTPATSELTLGSEMVMTSKVTGTGIFKNDVVWKLDGAENADTSVDPYSGRVKVSRKETAKTLTVTATAVDGTKGTATITVK